MSEIDYQMALLLQHRFEQEHKATTNTQKSDQELARALQEQFEQETATENPSFGLVYSKPNTAHNSSKCLVDPSWELVDPTPDIHNLFILFNQRFFWNKLLAVCVSWSKKMTSCAGVCSYNGRGGMCSITLSEPLLKLRPRKDLVETLLHEMIHAYLFVTHNNKDRDGHGPEFLKHMYRINKESGTNITVYHDFHDEVRLYQQHWWRCDGPCQTWKPYFGMVKRASNRAPGPNDRWWADHSRRCGGTFIKVKEPEKVKKDKKTEQKVSVKTNKEQKVSVKNNKDIRDFLGGTGASNVKGFKDLGTKVKGKYNSSSTIVVTKNSNTGGESSFKPTLTNPSSVKTSSSRVGTGYSEEFISVRDHWANKFNKSNKRATLDAPSTSSKIPNKFNSSNKRPPLDAPSTSSKVPKLSDSSECCDCPVCNKKVLLSDLNSHLDLCLIETKTPEATGLPPEETKECPLCNRQIPASSFDPHVEKCLMKIYDGVEEQLEETVACLACGAQILKKDLNSHLDDCMLEIFDVELDNADEKEEIKDECDKFNCPFCLTLVPESEMKVHIDGCLKSGNEDIWESLTDDAF